MLHCCSLVASLTSVSRAGYYGLLSCCTTSTCFYLAAGLNCLAGLQSIIVRSSLAATVDPAELGSMFAMLEVVNVPLIN